jgi:hypothetical protein
MRSTERIRLLVFSIFLAVLIVFAMVYQPVDAVSHPAHPGNAAVLPTGK